MSKYTLIIQITIFNYNLNDILLAQFLFKIYIKKLNNENFIIIFYLFKFIV